MPHQISIPTKQVFILRKCDFPPLRTVSRNLFMRCLLSFLQVIDMANLTTQLLYSFVLALVYGLTSYFKNSKEETFDLKAFLKTLLIGVFVGAVMYSQHFDYDVSLSFVTTNGFLMMLIDMIINNLFRRTPQLKTPKKVF